MLGLAGVFVAAAAAVLGPAAAHLRSDLPGLRGKLVLAPLAVLLPRRRALLRCPRPQSWPLHHGYGGVLGDLGLGLLASLLAHVNPDRSAAAAGLFCFAAGLMVLMSSLGLTQRGPQADLPDQCAAQVVRAAGRLVQSVLRSGVVVPSARCRRSRHPIADTRAAGAAPRAEDPCSSEPDAAEAADFERQMMPELGPRRLASIA